MLTIVAERFDFRESFPAPRDAEWRWEGGPGLFCHEEDAPTTDAEWVAFLHRAWCEELLHYYTERAYLLACIKTHTDPGTSKPPRSACAWEAIETRARAEVLRLDIWVRAILGNYASHFGMVAAEAFASFVLAAVPAPGVISPTPRAVFSAGNASASEVSR